MKICGQTLIFFTSVPSYSISLFHGGGEIVEEWFLCVEIGLITLFHYFELPKQWLELYIIKANSFFHFFIILLLSNGSPWNCLFHFVGIEEGPKWKNKEFHYKILTQFHNSTKSTISFNSNFIQYLFQHNSITILLFHLAKVQKQFLLFLLSFHTNHDFFKRNYYYPSPAISYFCIT